MPQDILQMQGITLVYGNGVVANDNVDFSVREGEIHALMGENGAGKSTLMKVLFGIEQPTSGTITFGGKQVSIGSTNAAIALGIGMVHQHFMLVPSLTVAENTVLGCEPRKGLSFDKKAAFKATEELSRRFGFDLDPAARVETISVGKKQKLEILKAIHRNARLLILDEPTAVLAPQETEELFEQLKEMRKNGITIIFISHKLNEIKAICDRMTIMRAGRSMGTYDVHSLSQQEISNLMVGRDVVLKVEKTPAKPGRVCLAAKNLSAVNEVQKVSLNNASFTLREGEILGIAGIEGSGQKYIVDLITGLRRMGPDSGAVEIDGRDASGMSIHERRAAKLAYIPEDRIAYGVAKSMSIRENLIASEYDSPAINGRVFMDGKAVRENAESAIRDYAIRASGPEQAAGMLSGGNMQKVVVAREFRQQPKILIADQPTRGVDVGAIEFIHKMIVKIRDDGCGVLLVSADLNEILELSDSILVMSGGEITAYFENTETVTEEELGYYMLGVKMQTPDEIRRACHGS